MSDLKKLCGTEVWVFDLDNTLYPSETNLFAQVDQRMTAFIASLLELPANDARKVQKEYYAQYGTTLFGLMKRHHVDPEHFLDYVHDIDFAALNPCDVLRGRIATLPGKKYVFTNGSRDYAERVLEARGLSDLFDGLFDISAAELTPKPHREAYDRFLSAFQIAPSTATMFEDIPRNLEMPYAMGMTTVLVRTAMDWSHEPAGARPAGTDDAYDHVHYCTSDLAEFLGGVHHALNARSDT